MEGVRVIRGRNHGINYFRQVPCNITHVVALSPASLRFAQRELGAPEPPPSQCVVRRLTIEEARQLASANNKALTLARLNVQEKSYATDAAVQAAG